jgi:cyanophycin synthetase
MQSAIRKFITGFDFRILVIDSKHAATVLRTLWNGWKFNSRIATENPVDPAWGYGTAKNVPTHLMLWDTEDLHFLKLNYTLETIPEMMLYI